MTASGVSTQKEAEVGAETLPRHPVERVARLALVGVILLDIVLYRSGGEAGWTSARVAETVSGAGSWGIVGFILAFSFLQPLGVSGHVFCFAATAL